MRLDDPCDEVDRFVTALGAPNDIEFHRPTLPAHSLVILRNFGAKATDQQQYLPSSFFKGILPEPLIEDYLFWQVFRLMIQFNLYLEQ